MTSRSNCINAALRELTGIPGLSALQVWLREAPDDARLNYCAAWLEGHAAASAKLGGNPIFERAMRTAADLFRDATFAAADTEPAPAQTDAAAAAEILRS